MSSLGQHKPETEEEVEIDLVPIMNTFLVLVPFLLLSAAFFHLKAIDTSTPVLAEASPNTSGELASKAKVTAIMEIRQDGFHLSAVSETLRVDELRKWQKDLLKEKKDDPKETVSLLREVFLHLKDLKKKYPLSNTLIIIPEDNILYDTIIQAMDVARYDENQPLFPRTILSGKVS